EELASPQAVRAVTQHRLSRLSPATTEVMELGAVVGATFDLRVLEEAVGDAELVQPVEEALASGTIEELPGPGLSFRFSHELVRRALYDPLSSPRRARLHLRVGEALERVGADAAELAHHFTIAAPIGGVERAVEYNLRAAEAAVLLFAFADAEGFAVEAL